ncbi:MAG: DNA-directed RNA polymerase subunit alpha [Leptospiraceae bacterium]|nr:DNA-directed RNA polymerase subunit alpha [Leptospiraceae bacterium]MBK7058672.1 DNA-directed RNA polymerase subunit alpha [Leptospiraceae bacterium]MBK9498484.1 DNA-directed RNA polymerase subunit alpha [Leptospiraceae bacterium]MBL0264878.1 DNA-directed RNA polymerase subunit alpha [Leptospiraceae bacterium]MBP9161942.1 DNA-directed RNA polymerase subunit alpha [Leptospiraceae bacterium]
MSHKNLLKGFKRPKKIEYYTEVNTPNYGKFIAEPFERGFATTLGNSLRRTLMSSIEGSAISAIRIEGVTHEFSYIEGISEDVSRIILNLKQVRIKYEPEDKDMNKIIHIELKGAGYFKAGDLAVDSSIEIMNPDLLIATLNEDANLVMDIEIQRGKGYYPAEEKKKDIEVLGTIPIDSLFSPIQKVLFEISETRVAQRSDYEKLTLEIWTDGSISPEDALAQAAKILKEHLTIFINFEEEVEEEVDELDEADQKLKVALSKHVEELELSVRSLNILRSLEIDFVGDLVKRNEDEMTKSRHYSDECLNELKAKLATLGLSFGMRDF